MTIHLDHVRQFLTERYSPEQVAPAGAGVWSTAFIFEHHGQPLVARFGRHVEDFRKDRRAAALYGLRIPVPRVLEIGEAFDGYVYAISEWANGEVIDGLPETHLRAALPSLLDTLDRLRAAVDVLLKDMENHEQRSAGDGAYDFSEIRRELRLE